MYDHLASVDVTSLQERVYQSLRLSLLKGHFLPGDAISIRKLADALGTSAMPVREAVKRLTAEKALVQFPNRQIRVAPFNPQLHEEYVRIRIQLEGYAAERAIRAHSAGLVERLKELNAAMLDAANLGEIEAALAANHAFHFEICREAGYSQLIEILENLWVRTGPVLAMIGRTPADVTKLFENGHKCHARAIEAIVDGDAKAARRAIALDLRAATMRLRKIYDPQAIA
jgi:DNA-binding GntR family transcriptional regulator